MIDNITAQLRRDEGEVLTVYNDSLGYATIGVGRLVDKRKGGGITSEESAYLLNNDIKRKTAEVITALPWSEQLDPVRFSVLVNMAFQMGINGLLGFKNTLALIRGEDFDRAAENMLASKWRSQTPERAQRLADQLRTGEWR